jgi:Ni,Fe-hydrogenase III component G
MEKGQMITKEMLEAIQKNYQDSVDQFNKNLAVSIHKRIAQKAESDFYTNLAEHLSLGNGCSGHECFFRRTGVRCSRCKI